MQISALTVITWNVDFKSAKAARKVCNAMRGLGIDICGLQEVAKMGIFEGFFIQLADHAHQA